MWRRSILIGVSLGVVAGTAISARAEETRPICPICHRANDQHAPYSERAGMTLVRGAMNTAFGWTELLVEPTKEANASGNVLFGVGKGMGLAVKRTAVGLGELLTFWTPKNKKEGYLSLTTDCPICFPSAKPPSEAAPAPATSKSP